MLGTNECCWELEKQRGAEHEGNIGSDHDTTGRRVAYGDVAPVLICCGEE